MKAILGGLCLVVGLLSAGGLLWGMVRLAWLPRTDFNPFLAFFGFGIPMVVAGGATGGIWQKEPRLLKCLGWVCTVMGLIWALGLLALVAGWVGLLPTTPSQPAESEVVVGLLLAFGIPMLVCGGAGIGILMAQEKH
jgi:hypothetical protein